MESTSARPHKTLTALDYQIEASVGRTVDLLWKQHAHGLLDMPYATVAEAHRAVAQAETTVTCYRVQLARLASGEFPVDDHLFARLDRTVDLLEEAADERDAKQVMVLDALRPIEAEVPAQDPRQVSAADFAAPLAIAQAAKLHEHLLTQRLAVATPSRTRISYNRLRRLEEAGLLHRDTSHPLHAGQPITLTAAGRAVLTTPRPRGRPAPSARRPPPLRRLPPEPTGERFSTPPPKSAVLPLKAPMPTYEPDFRLDGYEAVNERVFEAFWQHIDIHQSEFTLLADHHTDDGRHSFYVMHDRSVTYGIPGEPQIVALHLKRDPRARAFAFSHDVLPLPAMAQSWLIARGCPQEAILLPEDMGTAPADQATQSLVARLRGDGDHFALLTSYTDDSDPFQTTVLLRALDEKAPVPFRVLLEETDTTTWTHTLREGGFATFQAATEWWEAHWNGENVPLPAASPAARHEQGPVPGLSSLPAPPHRPSR